MHTKINHLKLVIITTLIAVSFNHFAEHKETGVAIFSHGQYQIVTGCTVPAGLYYNAMKQIIASVVFKDEPVIDNNELKGFKVVTRDMHYTRRHTRDFFGPFMQLHKDGSVCALDSLVTLAKKAGFPEQSENPIDTRAFMQIKKPLPDQNPYMLMTRSQYMNTTSCLVSPHTFEKYRMAFFSHVFSFQHGDDDPKKLMPQFLQETGEGRRTDKNTLDPMCLTPTVKRIAGELSLLNNNGEYQLK